jgi:GNAT superfamily N-acetyltransferase
MRDNTEVIIREVLPEDVGELVKLCADHAQYERISFNADGFAERIWRLCTCGHSPLRIVVAVVANRLVGYASSSLETSTLTARSYLHLDCLFVDAGHRGLGIGAQLLANVRDWCAEQGIVEMQWQTPDWNAGALRFYVRQGATLRNKIRCYLNMTQAGNQSLEALV